MLGKSLAEIDQMEASEIFLWKYYIQSEPRGEKRFDYQFATVCQAIYTILSAFAKHPKPISLENCILKFQEVDEIALKKKQLSAIVGISAAMGGNSKKHKQMIEDLNKELKKSGVNVGD